MIKVAQWSKLSDRSLAKMREMGRPVTAAELIFLGGLTRTNSTLLTEALQAMLDAGIITREERIEPVAHGSRVRVNRVYYSLRGD